MLIYWYLVSRTSYVVPIVQRFIDVFGSCTFSGREMNCIMLLHQNMKIRKAQLQSLKQLIAFHNSVLTYKVLIFFN